MSELEISHAQNQADRLDVAGATFDELLAAQTAAIYVTGTRQVEKPELLGVPLIVTRVTFWHPPTNDKGEIVQRGFVTCEATVGTEKVLQQAIDHRLIPNVDSLDKLGVFPNERIHFNDGSTGIRRTVVESLDQIGAIVVGNYDDERRYDLPWTDWDSFSQSRQQGDFGMIPSFDKITVQGNEYPLQIRAFRGLRVSPFKFEGRDVETWYFG